MPLMFRTMLPDAQGKPKIGSEGGPGLGVRVPPDPNADVMVDANGQIAPRGKGMSVAPSIGDLLPHLIPKRLWKRYPKAAGRNDRVIFSMGEGAFVDSVVAPNAVNPREF